MDNLVAIIVAVIGSGVLNTIVNQVFASKDKRRVNEEEIKHSLRLLMKDRLRFLCIHYINQEWIYEDELEDLIDMHKCYHDDLKGNGYLDELMKRVKELEIKGIGVK